METIELDKRRESKDRVNAESIFIKSQYGTEEEGEDGPAYETDATDKAYYPDKIIYTRRKQRPVFTNSNQY